MKLLELFQELTVRPQNAKELKGLILQLAVQGKLTAKWREEHPNVEPASELLKRIQKEKEELVKAKKIRKEKALPKIEEDEKPYAIPANWNFVKLESLANINGGFAFKSSKYVDHGIRVIRISDFDENGFKDHKIVRYEYSEELDSYELENENILMAMTGGTVGKTLYVKSLQERMVVNQRVATIKLSKSVESGFVNCVLPTREIQAVIENAKNSTNDNISMRNIKDFIIPLPPLQEQQAIVEIVESLFKEVEQLETLTEQRIQLKEEFATSALRQLTEGNSSQEWQQLQPQFSTFFDNEVNIKKLRETILQLAVQGKLTANWRAQRLSKGEAIEPASELLQRIKTEKECLIAEKKIKKEKPLPPISEEEIPFELPEGWEWCYLGTSMLKITDGTHHSPTNVEKGEFKYVTAKNIKSYGIELSNITFVSKEVHEEIYARCNPEFGDMLYIKDGATTGICCLNNLKEEFSMLSSVALIKQPDELLGDYLLTVMRSPYYYELMRADMSGVAITRVTLKKLKESMIPIPPFKEQKAIVEKVNQLMAYCDELEEHVKENQTYAEQLMQSVLREVFEGEKQPELKE